MPEVLIARILASGARRPRITGNLYRIWQASLVKRLLVLPLLLAVLAPAPTGYHAMVATEQRLASQVGLDVLRSGGNAVDAAVAVGYALAVVDPCCGNLGGGGFMLIRMHDGRERFIDFREKAPLRATRDMYLDAHGNVVPGRSVKGWLAAGVPGTVMGLERARTQYGTMSRARLLAPAIALARDGYVLIRSDLQPFASGGGAYTYAGEWTPHERARIGERIVQPQLAHTLESIAAGGPDTFYRGWIARSIVQASRRGGGILSMRDFASYDVAESAPLHCAYGGLTIISAPPPSSGGVTLCEIFHIVAPYPLAAYGWHSVRETHVVIEAERRAYADRNAYLGDPAFVRNPVAQLLSPAYAQQRRATILPRDATPSSQIHPGLHLDVHESDDTTHYSIVDARRQCGRGDVYDQRLVRRGRRGAANRLLDERRDGRFHVQARCAEPLRSRAGQSQRNCARKASALLDGADDRAARRQARDGDGQPGRLAHHYHRARDAAEHFAFGMDAQQAVDAPRIHMQWLPDVVEYEPGAFSGPA